MENCTTKLAETLIAGMTLFVAIAIHTPAKAASLIQQDLFFGRNISGGGQVSEAQFQGFVDREVTPRFPAGLTIFDADGQFLDSAGILIQEPSKVITLFAEDTPENERAIDSIVAAYLQQFNQESVLQVTNEDEFRVAFGSGEDIIDNDSISEFIEAELLFGRNIPGGGEVSEQQFQAFVDSIITPRFPAGLTIFDANGQFQDSINTIVEERSKAVTLLLEDTVANEQAIDEVIAAYIQQFNQESVLLAVNEAVEVGFGAGENLIDNDLVPEFIQADLFFGRNIPGGGQVSEAEFQAFVNGAITPRFPTGLTIFDVNGQFQDDRNTIIEEPAKVVRLLLEDTVENEGAIDQIITTYTQQFNQQSVLLVVDEDITVDFDAESPTDIPEPSLDLGLLAAGVFGVVLWIKKRSVS